MICLWGSSVRPVLSRLTPPSIEESTAAAQGRSEDALGSSWCCEHCGDQVGHDAGASLHGGKGEEVGTTTAAPAAALMAATM